MAEVVYPSSLPNPSLSAVTPAERRVASDVSGGPQEFRGLQRDYLATQRAEWNQLDADQAAAFDAWWRDTLLEGGAWFASDWPMPAGWATAVRRFLGVPQWQHQAGGFWVVSAELQVRGRGELPQTPCTDEAFGGDLGAYTVTHDEATGLSRFAIADVDGDRALTINYTGTTNPSEYAEIARPIRERTLAALSFDFQILTATDWDTGGIVLYDAEGDAVLFCIPRRQYAFGTGDPDHRFELVIAGAAHFVTSEALLTGEWYSAAIVVAAGADASSIEITRRSDGVVETFVIPENIDPPTVASLAFSVDYDGDSSVVAYANVHIC